MLQNALEGRFDELSRQLSAIAEAIARRDPGTKAAPRDAALDASPARAGPNDLDPRQPAAVPQPQQTVSGGGSSTTKYPHLQSFLATAPRYSALSQAPPGFPPTWTLPAAGAGTASDYRYSAGLSTLPVDSGAFPSAASMPPAYAHHYSAPSADALRQAVVTTGLTTEELTAVPRPAETSALNVPRNEKPTAPASFSTTSSAPTASRFDATSNALSSVLERLKASGSALRVATEKQIHTHDMSTNGY